MKRCPNCDKTFPDSMKFCQTDGTLLVADSPPVDPYKTVVGNQDDIASAIPPADPFKTMVAAPPKADDNILDLPDEKDALKTMVVSQEEMDALKKEDAADASPLDLPAAPSAPVIEPQPPASADAFKPQDSSLNPPSFGDLGKSEKSDAAPAAKDSGGLKEPPPSKFDSKTFPTDFSSQSPYSNPDSQPIPSPFQDSMPPGGFQPPFGSPFSEPKSPSKPEPAFREPEAEANQSPFGQAASTPFEQNEWTPPPAPVSNWQNQEIGANTPFQPPVAAGGQNQTLAIVSLVLGIVGIVICQLTAPVALVTGFMARKKAIQNPNEYGGSGFALAGIITGAIGTLLFLLVILYVIFVIGFTALSLR